MEINTRFRTNVAGKPFVNDDPSRPNEAFFKHVDYVIGKASALGMYVSLVPLDSRWASRGVFTPTTAYTFGRYLGGAVPGGEGDLDAGRGHRRGRKVPAGPTLWRNWRRGSRGGRRIGTCRR